MAKRRGPEDGYDFGAKRQYRREIWAQARRFFGGHCRTRICALLPSLEGDEIEAALQAGFNQSNLCIIDENPAIVATLKRRYPHVHTYGVTAQAAAPRIASDFGKIDFANLDLCGPIGSKLWQTLAAWREARVIKDDGIVAVTVLRGRERKEWGDRVNVGDLMLTGAVAAQLSNDRDHVRLGRIAAEFEGLGHQYAGRSVSLGRVLRGAYRAFWVKAKTYKSSAGSQTMLWGMWKVHEQPCICDECVVSAMAGWMPDLDPSHREHVGIAALRIRKIFDHLYGAEHTAAVAAKQVRDGIKRDLPQIVRRTDRHVQ